MSNVIIDPISLDQKKQIYDYVYGNYFKGKDLSGPRIDVIYKHYFGSPFCTDYLSSVKKIFNSGPNFWEQNEHRFGIDKISGNQGKELLEESGYEELRATIKDPRLKAKEFGIDPDHGGQVFATRVFIKTMIKCDEIDRPEEVLAKYAQKMNGGSSKVSAKNRLLMKADPVQKLESLEHKPTALDIVLANTHFLTPHYRNVPAKFAREQARILIKRKFNSLWSDPEKRYLIDCLAALMKKEKGQIFISDCKNSLGDLMKNTHENSYVLGMYNHQHSLYLCAMDRHDILGTFGHELLHMLSDHIPLFFEHFNEPLNEAIQKDREIRKGLQVEKLDKYERMVYDSVVKHLEKSEFYFPHGYKPEETWLMHSEAIVRPMENLINGAPLSALEKVMPNLWAFYRDHAVPALKAFYL